MKYIFYWRDGKVDYGEGETPEQALTALGYGGGAIAALDYWELDPDTQAILNNLPDGVLLSFTAKDYGKFRLARIVTGPGRLRRKRDERWAYVSEDGKGLVYSVYSGGETGGGVNFDGIRTLEEENVESFEFIG